MAVDPLPSNNTPVLFTHYSFNGSGRTLQARCSGVFNFAALVSSVGDFLSALAPIMDPDWAITGADWRVDGGIVSLPVTPPTAAAAAGTSVPIVQNPLEVRFVGRGITTGRRVTVSVYGLDITVPDDYRLEVGDSASLDAALEVLNTSDSGLWTTIGGDKALWYPYYNVNYNSHWEKEART